MNLAAILGFCLLGPGYLSAGSPTTSALQSTAQPPAATSSDSSTQQSQVPPEPQPPAQPAQNPELTQPQPHTSDQTPNSPDQAKPSPTSSSARHRRHKKAIPSNCSGTPSAPPSPASNPADPTNSPGPAPTSSGSTALPPCPPPKKVVRNGGSDEPSIQLVGGATAEQAVHQRSTDQLTTATNENLKRIAGRQLKPSQQEMVNQIKQFMDQSKTAIAAGDVERGHNLALKAHLLSDELVKP
jgi:hypothetical protein